MSWHSVRDGPDRGGREGRTPADTDTGQTDSLPGLLEDDQRVGGVPGEGARAQRLVVLPPGGVPTRLAAVARLQSHNKTELSVWHHIQEYRILQL